METFIEHLGITVTESLTTPKKAGKQPRKVWNITGNVAGLEDTLYALGGQKWKGNFSFWENPTSDLQALDESERLSFAEQQEHKRERAEIRADRLEERASNHAKAARDAFDRSDQAVAGIPMGQPILIGHHSEKRHRNALKRSDNAMRKGVEEQEYAQHLSDRAEGNRQKAEGKHLTLEYCGNRLQEAQAELNDINRTLQRQLSDQERVRIEQHRDQIQERIDYWTEECQKLGGDKYSKATIKVGDYVRYMGNWFPVERVNAKSVTARPYNKAWTDTIPYHKLTGHKSQVEFDALIESGQAYETHVSSGYILSRFTPESKEESEDN